MAVFTPSTIPWVSAVQNIADSAGASGDAEMQVRAHMSLRAAFQHFNGKYKWYFMQTEAPPIPFVAPFGIAITATSGSVSASALTGHGVLVDDLIVGNGFTLGTRVTATGASGFGFNVALILPSGAQSYTVTAQRDFYDVPADFKSIYSLRLLVTNLALRHVSQRQWGRVIGDENAASTPYWYELFRANSGGKIKVMPPPNQGDILLRRYYRRMFLASASGVATAIDIPEDYESYPIAWAKWHFLTDKGEGRKDQATTWLSLAQEGLKTMLADQTTVPDHDLAFTPGHATLSYDRSSTRWIDWNQ